MRQILIAGGRTMGRSWIIEQIAKSLGEHAVKRLELAHHERRHGIFDEWRTLAPPAVRSYPVDRGGPSGVAKAKRAKRKRRARRG